MNKVSIYLFINIFLSFPVTTEKFISADGDHKVQLKALEKNVVSGA